MVNPKRGQIKIKINEQEFDCRVTLDAILKMETLLGGGLMQILQKLAQGTLKTSEIISILLPVIRSSGKDIDEKKEVSLAKNLTSKYGKGSIDLKTGTFTSID